MSGRLRMVLLSALLGLPASAIGSGEAGAKVVAPAGFPSSQCLAIVRQARIADMRNDPAAARAHLALAAEPCGATLAAAEIVALEERLDNPDEVAVTNARAVLARALEEGTVPWWLVVHTARDRDASDADLLAAYQVVPADANAAQLEVKVILELRLGLLEAAAATLETLAGMADTPWVHSTRLSVALDREDWPTALAAFDRMERDLESDTGRKEEAAVMSWHRAELLARSGRLDEVLEVIAAKTELEVVATLISGPRLSWLNSLLTIGFAARDLGRHADAKRVFELAAAKVPESVVARRALIAYYATPEERVEHQAKLAAIQQEQRGSLTTPEELFSAGTDLLLEGKAADALPLLRQAAEARPHDPLFWRNYVLCAQRLERWELVAETAAHFVTLDPTSGEMYRLGGRALAELDRCGEALERFELAIQVAPKDAGAYFDLARCLVELGRAEEAHEWAAAGTKLAQESSP